MFCFWSWVCVDNIYKVLENTIYILFNIFQFQSQTKTKTKTKTKMTNPLTPLEEKLYAEISQLKDELKRQRAPQAEPSRKRRRGNNGKGHVVNEFTFGTIVIDDDDDYERDAVNDRPSGGVPQDLPDPPVSLDFALFSAEIERLKATPFVLFNKRNW